MDLNDIYLKIRRAQLDEAANAGLATFLAERIPYLHPAIQLEQDPVAQLTRFVEAYIKQVPKLILDAAQHCTDCAPEHWLRQTLVTVRDVFRTSYKKGAGMRGMLGRAYLAHRIIEELNDRFIQQFGYTLVEPDLTRANLVAYQLLGEQAAGYLDQGVDLLTERLLQLDNVRLPVDEPEPNVRHVESWVQRSCLSSDSGLKLNWKEH